MRHFATSRRMVSMAVMLLCLVVGIGGGIVAQSGEALDLPADLYVLTNEGVVQRFGIGAAGVQAVTPADAYVLDFGVDDERGIIAYRTEAGLFSVPIDGGAPTALDANAGFPAYRGHGRTIAYAPQNDAFPITTTIVYATENSIRAAFIVDGGGTPIFQDFTEAGAFNDLNWSPDGRFLAAGTDENIWWVYRRDATTLTLTSVIVSSVGTTWVSGGEIVFAPVEGGLKIMNLDLANQQTDLLDASYEYRLPYLTQDDQLVFFGRAKDSADVPSGYGSLIRLARGAAQVSNVGQTPIELTGLRWSPGGFLMTAFQAGVLAVFDPITGFGFPLPIENTVAYEWGAYVPPELRPTTPSDQPSVDATLPPLDTTPNDGGGGEVDPDATPIPLGTAVGMALPAAAFFIAPNNWGLDQVWRLPSDGSAPVVATYEDFDVTEYAIAPNRSDVSYIANGQVWLATPQFPYGVVVARLRTFAPATPIFSPDGTRIIYAEKETGIYIINPSASNEEVAAERLIANGASEDNPSLYYEYTRPQYSPQGNRLLVEVAVTDANDLEGGGFALGVYDFETQQVFQTMPFPRTDPRTANARWLLDGRIVAHSDANTLPLIEPGFYVFDFIGATATPTLAFSLPSDRVVRAEREISAGVMRVLLANISDPSAPLEVVEYTLADGNARMISRFEPIIGSPRFSADGQWLIGFHLVEGVVDRGAPLLINALTGAATVITTPNGTSINARQLSF